MKWQSLKWFVVPIAILAATDVVMSRVGRASEKWYPAYVGSTAFSDADWIFVGSSRVAAAIVPEAIAAETGTIQAINLGQGYSTTAEHLLGLQKLAGTNPQAFTGKTVFIEAPGGIPEHIIFRGGEWLHPQNPALMLKVSSPSDLPDFWKSHAHHEELIHITTRTLLKPSGLLTYKELAQGKVMTTGATVVKDLTWRTTDENGDLSSAGGIRTDAEGRKVAIDGAKAYIETQTKGLKSYQNWDGTCVERIIELVTQRGGRVAFFETPLDSSFKTFYDLPLNQQSRANFRAWAEQKGVTVIPEAESFEDEAFPDVWHLDAKLAPEFSRALARNAVMLLQ